MKPTQHDIKTRMKELQISMAESRSNIRLQESFLREDRTALQAAQRTYNRRTAAIEEERQLYADLDRELAEMDGRLQEYTRAGKVHRPRQAVKAPTMDDLVGILKGMDPTRLNDLLSKIA